MAKKMNILRMYTNPKASGPASASSLIFAIGDQILDGVTSVKFGETEGDGMLECDSIVSVTITCFVTLGKEDTCQS